MHASQNAANGVVKVELNGYNETMECTIHSTIRATAKHARRGKGADNVEGDDEDMWRCVGMGVDQCGRERLGKRGRRHEDRKNNEGYEGKEGRGDIHPDAGSVAHRTVRRVNVWKGVSHPTNGESTCVGCGTGPRSPPSKSDS
jgi:hypothetical protein